MRLLICLAMLLLMNSCTVSIPRYDTFQGGQKINQPGISFVLPKGKPWSTLLMHTYEANFGRFGESKLETFVVMVSVYNLPNPSPSKDEFLKAVKESRSNEPNTGRFQEIRNYEGFYESRPELCVIHKAASRDYGVEAKRGGEFSIYETFGMNCVHPEKPAVGVLIELSRKAPPEFAFPGFDEMGTALLQSVTFGKF